MSSKFIELAPELKLSIIEELDFKDHINLSSTCKALRAILVPFIFKKVVLKNTDESGDTVSRFLEGPYTPHIKTLHFKGYAPGPEEFVELDSNYDADEQDVLDAVLPPSVVSVFENASLSSSLDSLIIEVPTWTEEEMTTAFYLFDLVEDDDGVKQDEEIRAWRRLMRRTYELVTNFEHVRHLEIRAHVPKLVSSWNTPAFRTFLNRLETFKLSLRGVENGAGWNLNTCIGWVTTTEAYGRYLFHHLSSVKSLTIESCNEAPLGLKSQGDGWFAELSIHPAHVPKLQHLHLRYVLLCPELRDVICASSDLVSVKLVNSGAEAYDYEARNPVSWGNFLNTIARAAPAKLQSFEILIEREQNEEKGPADLTTRKEHLLNYMWDTKYGSMPVDYWEKPEEDDTTRDDEAAFDRLMAVIDANRK